MFNIIKNKTIAIIPARSGSKGIKDKNIVDICGFPLIAYSIMAACMCKEISRVIVSTDSDKYAEIAMEYGAEIPFLRPKELAGSQSQDIEYLTHALQCIEEKENCLPEYIVLLRPTTPLRNIELIKQAIAHIKVNEFASSVVSVHYAMECPYKWMKINKNGYLESPFQEMRPDDVNLPRQSFEKLLIPDGYVDVLKSKTILDKRCVYGDKALPFLVQQDVIDIDNMEDLDKIVQSTVGKTKIYSELCKIKSKSGF